MNKKIAVLILSILNLIILICSILYLMTGSLELFPTEEQQEKSAISFIILTLILVLVQILLYKNYKKQKKMNDF